MATVAHGASVLDALVGRWKPVYQEVDGQMVSPAISAATVVEIQGNQFKVLTCIMQRREVCASVGGAFC